MLYAQIIAWTAVVYVAILTVISILCAIAIFLFLWTLLICMEFINAID
jgi:hypothetical protein